MPGQRSVIRVGAIGDMHCGKGARGSLKPMLARVVDRLDVLLLAGDLTDYGLPEEAHVLAQELEGLEVPIVAVLGNHDYESGKSEEIKQILSQTGVKVLDGDTCEVHGLGIAGAKGFAGGFGRGTLGAWGENIIKQFVQEAIQEALKLETALARLRTAQRIALLHYAPIADTVAGEPMEIYPFLGCSRLAEPLVRYPVTAVFHGHAHRGTLEGRTASGIPVYNVSLPLLRQHQPGGFPCRIVEIPTDPSGNTQPG